MTQQESEPSVESKSEPDPLSRAELAKKDLHSLELLLGISERNLESTILERNKKTKELLALDGQWKTREENGQDSLLEAGVLMGRCKAAGDEQHELNLEIRRRNNQLLDIREAIVEKRNPL